MNYKYGFFDSVDLGNGNYDRVYSSAEFSHYWALLVGNGVFIQPSTSLNVVATTPLSMSIKVLPGTGWIKGHYLTIPDDMDEPIDVPVADPSLPRIDSIIMALNNNDRDMKLYVRSGTAAVSPTAVTLQRNDGVWELELAQITIAAGAGNITQQAIRDMRTDPDRCGIVTGLIDQLDVSGFFTAARASFDEWFEDVKIELGGDVAGNLQNQINSLKTNKVNVSDKANTAQAQAGTDDTKWMSPKKTSEAISSIVPFLPALLSTETKSIYGLSADTVPDTVFQRLLAPQGSYGFKVTINPPNGAAKEGFELPSDFVNLDGSSGVVTDSNGVAYCFARKKSFTTTFGTGYLGIVPKEVTCTSDTTKAFTPITVTLSNDSSLTSITLIESSKTYKLAGNISDADFCAVGGGGGGGPQYNVNTKWGGGAGGDAVNALAKPLSGKLLSIVIGSGGEKSTGSSPSAVGGTGGTTKVSMDGTDIVTASGGQGCQAGKAAVGNGKGGYNSAGGNGTVRVFNDPSLPLPGGGGGHGNGRAGGADFGAAGGGNNGPARNPTGPGGGGGGFDYGINGFYGNGCTNGHAGGVYLRVRYV